jgi:predicted signal transduction protein with EAL and GGDEF domain
MIPGTTTLRATQIAARLTGPPTRVTGSDGTPVSFTASIGIAESARCGDLPSLLTRADTAMYQAKRGGGACWRAFDGHHTGAGSGPADQVSTDVAGLELVEDQDGVSG